MAIGGVEKGSEMILWSSSELAEMGGGLNSYLPPAVVQRLIQEKVVLSPQTARYTIPQGIFKAAQGAILTVTPMAANSITFFRRNRPTPKPRGTRCGT